MISHIFAVKVGKRVIYACPPCVTRADGMKRLLADDPVWREGYCVGTARAKRVQFWSRPNASNWSELE